MHRARSVNEIDRCRSAGSASDRSAVDGETMKLMEHIRRATSGMISGHYLRLKGLELVGETPKSRLKGYSEWSCMCHGIGMRSWDDFR